MQKTCIMRQRRSGWRVLVTFLHPSPVHTRFGRNESEPGPSYMRSLSPRDTVYIKHYTPSLAEQEQALKW